jgi:hypothetical protein
MDLHPMEMTSKSGHSRWVYVGLQRRHAYLSAADQRTDLWYILHLHVRRYEVAPQS